MNQWVSFRKTETNILSLSDYSSVIDSEYLCDSEWTHFWKKESANFPPPHHGTMQSWLGHPHQTRRLKIIQQVQKPKGCNTSGPGCSNRVRSVTVKSGQWVTIESGTCHSSSARARGGKYARNAHCTCKYVTLLPFCGWIAVRPLKQNLVILYKGQRDHTFTFGNLLTQKNSKNEPYLSSDGKKYPLHVNVYFIIYFLKENV